MILRWFVFLLLSTMIVFGACEKEKEEHGDNEITINILKPTTGEVLTDATNVHIHIEIEATDENHEAEIILHPDGDVSDLILDYDEHSHDKVIRFEQDLDLSSYPSGTTFHLEVEACVDHDCEEKERADVEFSIQ